MLRPSFFRRVRQLSASFGFLLLGAIALYAGGRLLGRAPVPKPPSSGEVGEVIVYAQTAEGPHAISPGRTAVLHRPQAFAFQLTVEGTGPRRVRIDREGPDGTWSLYETEEIAPARARSLGYVARFDERAPDVLTLVVTLEAPHLPPRARRYPFRLASASERFWDTEQAPRHR